MTEWRDCPLVSACWSRLVLLAALPLEDSLSLSVAPSSLPPPPHERGPDVSDNAALRPLWLLLTLQPPLLRRQRENEGTRERHSHWSTSQYERRRGRGLSHLWRARNLARSSVCSAVSPWMCRLRHGAEEGASGDTSPNAPPHSCRTSPCTSPGTLPHIDRGARRTASRRLRSSALARRRRAHSARTARGVRTRQSHRNASVCTNGQGCRDDALKKQPHATPATLTAACGAALLHPPSVPPPAGATTAPRNNANAFLLVPTASRSSAHRRHGVRARNSRDAHREKEKTV